MRRPLIIVAAALFVGALVLTAPLSASAAAPTITISSPVTITNDTTPVSPFGGAVLADADNDNLTVIITWTAANGTLAGSGFSGSAGSITATGAPSIVTTQLQLLVFTPTVGATATTTFTITATDGVTLVSDSSASVQVSAVAVDLHIGATGTATYGAAATVTPVYPSGMTGVDTSGVTCSSLTVLTDPVASYAAAGLCSGAASQAGFNYNFIYDAGAVVIGPALLTVTASSGSGVYGALPTPTPAYAGFVNGEDPSVVSITCSIVAPASVPSAATTCAGTAANYALTPVNGTMTISQAPLTITPSNAHGTYGTAAPVSATYAGFVNSETNAVLSTQPTCTTSAGAAARVGGYPTTTSCAGAVATNYAITYGASGTTTITPAALSITALGQSRFVGQANGEFKAAYAGFVNGETIANLAGTLQFTTSASASSGPGSYPVQPGGVSSTDYAITFLPGTVTVSNNGVPTPTPTPVITPTHTPTPTPSPTPTRTSTPSPTSTPNPVPTVGGFDFLPWVIGGAGVVFVAAAIAIIAWRRRV